MDFDAALEPLLARDPRYPREAYHFLREALDHTQSLLVRRGEKMPRHVKGQELLDGIRDYALGQFGPMARMVLEEWGIRRCEDFGNLVFNLVDQTILSKTEQDRREDFQDGYDFTEAFSKPFLPQRRPAPSVGSAGAG
ncbi:MAG: Minf_1886 family protein [Verrucomicrobiota bacterium]